MVRYEVEKHTETKSSGKEKVTWIVRCPDGSIANGYHHPAPDGAHKHAALCNAFCVPWILEQMEKLKK